jgi:hypothetical protein
MDAAVQFRKGYFCYWKRSMQIFDDPFMKVIPMNETYKIFRSFNPSLKRENETIKTGLTLEEAQEHCQDPNTREDGVWFDGYTEE